MRYNIDLTLEEPCLKCLGTGARVNFDFSQQWRQETEECTMCNGLGWVPTQFGKSILDFVKRHQNKETKK